MELNLTEPQSEFFLNRESDYVAAVAGFGSGKTAVALARMIDNMIESPGLDQAYLAPTYPLIRDIWYPKVESFLSNMKATYSINEAKHTIFIKGLGKIICRTMEKPSSIVGWEVGDAFLDEFDILRTDKALEVFRRTSARLRQKNSSGRKNQLFVTTTPEGFKATYKLFKKEPLKNSAMVQMSTYSNEKNLPKGYIQNLLDQYPEQLIDAYLLGKFVNLTSGSVYYAFDRSRHNTHWVAAPREPLHIGMDFNIGDMCAVAHVIRDKTAAAVDEFMGLRDTPDMCEAIKEAHPDRKIFIYPDASGKNATSKSASVSDLSILKRAGFIIRAKSKNPRIKDRVACINAGFEKGYYFVNLDKCQEYAEVLEQQPYNKATGQPLKDGHLDNRVDGAGYFMSHQFPLKRPSFTTQAIGGY